MNPGHILFSKCIIRQVLCTQQWKDPFEEKKFFIPYTPQTFDYNDYRMAWFRTFLHRPETHSWFFNFHNNSLLNSPSGFITGGLGSVAVLLYYQLKHKVDGISGIRMSPPLLLHKRTLIFQDFQHSLDFQLEVQATKLPQEFISPIFSPSL